MSFDYKAKGDIGDLVRVRGTRATWDGVLVGDMGSGRLARMRLVRNLASGVVLQVNSSRVEVLQSLAGMDEVEVGDVVRARGWTTEAGVAAEFVVEAVGLEYIDVRSDWGLGTFPKSWTTDDLLWVVRKGEVTP